MSITIRWAPSNDGGRCFNSGTSDQYRVLVEVFGQVLNKDDVPILRAMAKAAKSKFYDEVADVAENFGSVNIWDTY